VARAGTIHTYIEKGRKGLWNCDARHAIRAIARRILSKRMWERLQLIRLLARTARAHLFMPKYPGMPLLSVVMAAYNTQDYISEALESLLHQQWRKVDIIVIDDGSTDGTANVASQFLGKDVHLVCTEHRGPGAARNTGAALARGKYIAFFDSDDIADPFFYRKAIFSLERTHSNFAIGSYQILKHGKNQLPPWYIQQAHSRTQKHVRLAEIPLIMTNALMCTRVYRREFYEKKVAPQPEGVLFEDQLITMKAFVQADGFDILHQSALQWRRRPTGDATTQQAADVENLIQRTQSYKDVADYLFQVGELDMRIERLVQLLATDQLTLSSLVVAPQAQEYFDVARDFLRWAKAEVENDKYIERVGLRDRLLQTLVLETDLETVKSYLLTRGVAKHTKHIF